MKRIVTFFVIALSLSIVAQAKSSSKKDVTVVIEPDHADWIYQVGDDVHVTAYALKNDARIPNVDITYSYGPDKLDAVATHTVTTDAEGNARFTVPGAEAPGFVTIRANVNVNGHKYSGMANVGFDPYSIKPTTTMPDDFEQFWTDAVAQAAEIPMTPTLRHSAKESNDRVDVYYLKLQSYRLGNFVYGVLTVPKTPGPKPAILRLPGAAVRSFHGPNELAYKGFVVLEIGVHGIPVDKPKSYYSKLEKGTLKNYTTMGIDNRDTYYYKRSILGCVRAIDYLCTRDDVDSTRIATYGGSQGGMLSIMTAALSPHVSALFAYFPAFCDLTGYYYGRGAGWPHLFRHRNEPNILARMEVSKYYDTVNFARTLKVPGFYAWGFNDPACCPTSTFTAYNVITAPKELQIGKETGHWLYKWQTDNAMAWLKERFHME